MPAPTPPDAPTAGDPPGAPAEGAAERPAPAPPTVSAFDRVQTRPALDTPTFTDAAGARGAFWRAVTVVVALGAITAAAVWGLRRGPAEDTDLLARLASVAATYEPALRTADPREAERYVEDASGWRIEAPRLPGLRLVGVGFADLSPQASVPAFRYDGPEGDEGAVVFAYDYVFLDSIRGSLALAEPVYAGLAEDRPVDTRRLDGALFVSWRRRAVIFTAVTESEAVFERVGVGVAE